MKGPCATSGSEEIGGCQKSDEFDIRTAVIKTIVRQITAKKRQSIRGPINNRMSSERITKFRDLYSRVTASESKGMPRKHGSQR